MSIDENLDKASEHSQRKDHYKAVMDDTKNPEYVRQQANFLAGHEGVQQKLHQEEAIRKGAGLEVLGEASRTENKPANPSEEFMFP